MWSSQSEETKMAQQDLSYAFQPVIHEPLSRADVSSLSPKDCALNNETNSEQKEVKDLFVDYSYLGYDGNKAADTDDGSISPVSSEAQNDEKEALASIEEADKCRNNHPRKAMSLYLKAGKALVLCNQADSALKCFRSLILLATEQLNRVKNEKKKIPKLIRSESETESETKERNKVARTKSCDLPKKQKSTEMLSPEITRRNCQSFSECDNDVEDANLEVAVEEVVQQDMCEFVAVEEVNNVEENTGGIVMDSVEQEVFVPEQMTSCEPVMEMEVQQDLPVFSVSEVKDISSTEEMTMSCESPDGVCVVNCFETVASLDFEVATVESLDDSASTHSSTSNEDIVQTLNTEIVMLECNDEVMMSAEEVPANPQQNAFIRRGYVVSELIDTEENYIRDLGHVIKGYMAALSKEFNVPNELKGKEKVIFSNIQNIHEWHSSDFVKDLKECEDDPSKLGEVFSSAETKLEELYTIYCRSKAKSDELVLPHKESFFKDCRKRLGHRLQLSDYLIKPVQRITKYQLLLRDILKFTEKAGEDGSEIQRALNVALRILKRTNDMISVASIQGYDAKPDDTGDLILRETLEVAEGKYRQKMKERNVFLFEKLIVVTEALEKEGGVTELRFHNSIKTRGLGQTETVDSDPCKWAVWLRKRSNAEIYVFRAPSIEVKNTWVKHIKECNLKKKAPGLLKSLYRSRTFRREESDAKEMLDALTPNLLSVEDGPAECGSDRKSRRKSSKVMSRKKKNSAISDRLKENILKFRAEEQMLSVEEPCEVSYAEPPDSLSFSQADIPQSPVSPDPLAQPESTIQRRIKIETEENQLKKVLLLTRLIAARLLQTKDAAEALSLYEDVIGSVLPVEELRKYEGSITSRDLLLQHCTEIYDKWRKENVFTSEDAEEPYTSITSHLSETAGFCSLHKGNPWSVVLYTVSAMAGSREQKWRDASQAFYRLSLVYSALQATSCAVDSLVDAHWMCCHAGDYQGAVNLFYNAFIRSLACRDLIRCLRFEQQGLYLVERLTNKDNNNNCGAEDDNESRGLVSSQHLAFLINMSRATRRKDWAWFEFAETELNIIVNLTSGRQAGAILSAVFKKMRNAIGESSMESFA
ncbi:rac guanine nucleotide exchange factor JJ-like [Actinia tenebrosa]|uniref:Rac guanine nucleotide exchange factor JJ-like n=1 Tax=Actinia tenebrosa TaxID=6105 RepID=A0A6P8I3R4_ACTTE|nr:rac guanine nucleotide exchange factor JJ-like [Actinia tenebrosa]